MEEESQLSKQIVSNEDGGAAGEDEEFYEKIEAPKFVDFTVSDPYRPDDRYWFCSRVGCDLKHEEEMDPEAIYKNFVLRVMAARSPNIRLRKALNRKAPSANAKCPLSAPAKPSKSRFALISSIPQKMVKPLPKLSSTPHAKTKQVAAKYLTTPRNKKCLPNPNSFCSVQNLKPTIVEVPKNRMVVKALVFNSPKKGICVKTSVELKTPLSKICEGMKKLEITSQRKRVLGYSYKSSKDIRRNPKKSLPLDPSGRQLNACKDKTRLKDSLHRQNLKDQEAKSLRGMKRESKGKFNNHCSSVPKEMVEIDSSDMEIDVKSRDGSTIPSSRINKHYELEEHLTNSTQEEAINSLEAPPSTENSDAVSSDDSKEARSSEENSDALLSDHSGGEMNTQSNSDERDLEENGLPKVQAPNGEGDEGSEGNDQEKKMKSSSEHALSSRDHLAENQPSEVAGHESEAMDSDDKENALVASDDNRNFDHNNNNNCGTKILGRQETSENTKKVVALMVEKNLKEGLTTTGASAQEVKYRKPKTTHPKPFRLRTDERGILKEANFERKNHFLAPQKEVAVVPKFSSGNSQKRQGGHDIQRNEKCLEQQKCGNDTHEGSEKELEENIQKVECKSKSGLKISKGQVRPRISMLTPQRCSALTHQQSIPVISHLEDGKDSMSKKSENHRLRKTKSSSLERQLIRPQRVASTKKALISHMTLGQQLGVIKETSSTISRPKEAGKLSESCTPPATKAIASVASSRVSSQRRRPATIPKKPNFHNVHVPKSCARKAT
ncbi:uncharacterized protein LOC132294181 [Cornus florida]|uniref:uncharacterized protein LOC132294181 n=1 Tax=Cornus florida TaxID=4283 RepID=UPI002896769F|nr:uncharacterized protein LOC132294181 [Cornus florida]